MRFQRYASERLPHDILVVQQIVFWILFFTLPNRGSFPPYGIALIAVSIIFFFFPVRKVLFEDFKPVIAAYFFLTLFSLFLYTFTAIYWSYGTVNNFGKNLTHLDAFYFAIGTLTTAGTGNINAISETARGLQALQMGLEFPIIGIVLTFGVTRYYDFLKQPRARKPYAHQANDGSMGTKPVRHEPEAIQPSLDRGLLPSADANVSRPVQTDVSADPISESNESEP